MVDTRRAAEFRPDIEPVIDMRDALSPLNDTAGRRPSSYQSDMNDEEGGI